MVKYKTIECAIETHSDRPIRNLMLDEKTYKAWRSEMEQLDKEIEQKRLVGTKYRGLRVGVSLTGNFNIQLLP